MSRDYKSRKSTSSKGGKGSLMLGVFIGYTLGIVSAIGLWFYLEQVPSPFLSEEQISAYDRADDDSDNKMQPGVSESPVENTPIATVEEKAQFDFYNILPGEDDSLTVYETPQPIIQPREVEKQQALIRPAPASAAPLSSPPPPAAETRQVEPVSIAADTYYLQVGSFRSTADADNLKARLALLGVVASVQSADLSEKGIWYRVRVGPFTQKARVDQVHTTLRENGIEAQFIKAR
ncbi:MAG: SPOR domain-containing protein [Burkholderiales bacterium]|nr:SPOR domain-containing protein [Nitrosomonas sp.]MCP5275021.1 SPOR domain-containing protein [Burkholderiales bacterium]